MVSRVRAALVFSLAVSQFAFADAGVLIPANRDQPDPSVLSIQEMKVWIVIDNGTARIRVRQIFASHTGNVLEGTYVFSLPSRASVSDFAVWDGLTRIPGVILERRRAQEIYENLRMQSIDPGLLQQGEGSAAEARRASVFSAKVVPIPGYGTKRLELEYHEALPVENLQSVFVFPLKPDAYQQQSAARFEMEFDLRSEHELATFEQTGEAYPLEILDRTPTRVRGRFEGTNVAFAEDFAVRFALDAVQGDSLRVLTYRDPETRMPSPTEVRAEDASTDPGFFQASALFSPSAGSSAGASEPTAPPRTVIVLMDTSLSMQWDKLERSFLALETLLHNLVPADLFNVVLYNNEPRAFASSPQRADPNRIQGALDFVRRSYLEGGTDLAKAFQAALGNFERARGNSYLVLLGDGNATRGILGAQSLLRHIVEKNALLSPGQRPEFFVLAVGDDANLPFLRMLTRDRGELEIVRSTEPAEFKIQSFVSKIGKKPLADLTLGTAPASIFDWVYPLQDTVYDGAVAHWVGQYKTPAPEANFRVTGFRAGEKFEMETRVSLPEKDLRHPHLPRTWAKARVDYLLEVIEREGEDAALIDEIVRLAKKYKFVTPYTSFLAAPRALLRPRVIRPGDPLLRVRTDASIESVVALFPFGLIKKLRYLPSEDAWQTRFLVPKGTADGTYPVRLVLRDRDGNVYRESKDLVIASQPPLVGVSLEKKRFRRGEKVVLRVAATRITRSIVARMPGAGPVFIHWDPREKINIGAFVVPERLPAGPYNLTVVAEDAAHNVGRQEVSIEIVP